MKSLHHSVVSTYLPKDWGDFYLVALIRTEEDAAVFRFTTESKTVAKAAATPLGAADDPERLAQSWRAPESAKIPGIVSLDEPVSGDTDETMGQRLVSKFQGRYAGRTLLGA